VISTATGSGSGSAVLNESGKLGTGGERPAPKVFSAQSYLRYQGDKVRPYSDFPRWIGP
jgi:hypothetical protein